MYLGKLPRKPKAPGAKSKPRLRFKGVRAGVDAERYIKRIKDIPVGGAKMMIRTRLVGVHKKGSGCLTENESELVGEDGEVYYKVWAARRALADTDEPAHGLTDRPTDHRRTDWQTHRRTRGGGAFGLRCGRAQFNGGGFQIGAYGFTDSGKTFSEKITPPANRAPDTTVELVTTPEQAHMYRLSLSEQIPSLEHGRDLHSSTSSAQFAPPNPGTQVQE